MAYDFHYPVLKFHQFDRYFRKASGICPVRQLVDVVRFACQFAEDVRILPVLSVSCLFSRGVISADTTACRTYSLTRSPASDARFLTA